MGSSLQLRLRPSQSCKHFLSPALTFLLCSDTTPAFWHSLNVDITQVPKRGGLLPQWQLCLRSLPLGGPAALDDSKQCLAAHAPSPRACHFLPCLQCPQDSALAMTCRQRPHEGPLMLTHQVLTTLRLCPHTPNHCSLCRDPLSWHLGHSWCLTPVGDALCSHFQPKPCPLPQLAQSTPKARLSDIAIRYLPGPVPSERAALGQLCLVLWNPPPTS